MVLGLRETRTLERRRRRWKFFKFLTVLSILGAAAVFIYQTGVTVAENQIVDLQDQVGTLTATASQLRETNTRLESAARLAEQKEQQWRQRYEQDVPTGEALRLFELVKKQLSGGADAKRLAFLIGAAAEGRSCANEPQTKRFLVRTPISSGAADSVSFGDGAITITAEGESATNPSGAPEGWFDSEKPVTIAFITINGHKSVASGYLPIEHSIVIGNVEHRFVIVNGGSPGIRPPPRGIAAGSLDGRSSAWFTRKACWDRFRRRR